MVFQPGVFQPGVFQGASAGTFGALNAHEIGSDAAALVGEVRISGTLLAIEIGSDASGVAGVVLITGLLGATETGADVAVFVGETIPKVWGQLVATEAGRDIAAFEGTSDGNIIVIPRDVAGGIGYLVEIGCYDHQTDAETTLYFASLSFNTLPTDTVPNQHFAERMQAPGNYERSLFSSGTTHGQISVGAGYIELIGNDGDLDEMRSRYAFDGYPLRIKTVEKRSPRYENAVLVFEGTTEQVELSWTKATLRLRDRLAEIDVPHQEETFAGTTISGGLNEAEGQPDDLKSKPKPLAYGAPPLVAAVAANAFDNIFALGADGLSAVQDVRDRGVALTYNNADYATITALRTASIAAGQFATARVLGLMRTGATPNGQITARPVEGPTLADRTAAQIARRMLERKGFVQGTHFLAADIAALDALNAAPIGYWMGTDEQTTLVAVQRVLGSIGATIVPDRLGVFRMLRFEEASGFPAAVLTRAEVIEPSGGAGIQLLATGDEGRGVRAWKVTVSYAHNDHVMNRGELDAVNTPESFKAFATQEWRTAIAEDKGVKAVHKLAAELTYDTWLIDEADAQAEADRLLALHSVARDRFRVPVKSFLVEHVELGSTVRLQLNRFGLEAGKDFVTIGIAENFKTGITTLDLWG